jgi:hypothetical protein
MKITKSQLKQIIKEEIVTLFEVGKGEEMLAAIKDVPPEAQAIAEKVRAEIMKLSEPSGLDPNVLSQAVAALLTADF